MKNTQVIAVFLWAVLGSINAQAEYITLIPGQSIQVNSDIISCQGRDDGGSGQQGTACMLHFENNAYHLYSVAPNGDTSVIGYWPSIDDAIRRFQELKNLRVCGRALPTCSAAYVNGAYHIYNSYYGKTTVVNWFESQAQSDELLGRLISMGECF